jgi:type IV secretory pathway VirJ component
MDVVVNIWEVLKLSQLQVRQTGPNTFRVVDADQSVVNVEFLHSSRNCHLIYAEGVYTGPLLRRATKGSCLVLLRSNYGQDANHRPQVTTRMDSFLSVEPGAAEVVAKTLQPLVGKVVDLNFVQTVAFLSSVSRTAEVNTAGVQRLASKLTHVRPEVRQQFSDLAAVVAERAAARRQQEQPSLAAMSAEAARQ